jgi:hypothetical protein
MPLKCRHASRSLILVLTVLIVAAWTADAFAGGRKGSGGDVGVKGYTRKDGTYVAPHTRSAPDSSPYNNHGMPGNYNPKHRDHHTRQPRHLPGAVLREEGRLRLAEDGD